MTKLDPRATVSLDPFVLWQLRRESLGLMTTLPVDDAAQAALLCDERILAHRRARLERSGY